MSWVKHVTVVTLGILFSSIIAQIYPLQPLPSNISVKPFSRKTVMAPPVPLEEHKGVVLEETSLTRWFHGIQGPESISVYDDQGGGSLKGIVMDKFGYLYSGNLSPGEMPVREAYIGPGRPLGFLVLNDERTVIICNSLLGLISYGLDTRQISIVSNGYERHGIHVPVMYANDLDILNVNGSRIYFTDSAKIPPAMNREHFYDTMQSYILSALSGRATGALLEYDRTQGTTTLLLDGLSFANGVAVSRSGEYVLVAETSAMRITKYYIKNRTAQVLVDSLPGYPDGMCRSDDGNFWVAIIAPYTGRSLVFEILRSSTPVRWMASWIFSFFGSTLRLPRLPRIGLILKISGETGDIIRVLKDTSGKYVSGVSGVHEYNGSLYLGHLQYDYITSIKL